MLKQKNHIQSTGRQRVLRICYNSEDWKKNQMKRPLSKQDIIKKSNKQECHIEHWDDMRYDLCIMVEPFVILQPLYEL